MNKNLPIQVYFIGIGGIGMSALAEYFSSLNIKVAGYDSTKTDITNSLIEKNINIHFSDSINLIPDSFKDKALIDKTLIVYTPAVPNNHSELLWFINNKYNVLKRAEILGNIASSYKTVAIAGSHGKTTVSTACAWLFNNSNIDAMAFLGGISKNYKSNFINSNGEYLIAEADEYDRSFHHLKPELALITSIDADHLDIYGNYQNLLESFNVFIENIKDSGALVIKKSILNIIKPPKIKVYTYAVNEKADFYASSISYDENGCSFIVHLPNGEQTYITIPLYGKHNVENITAAIALTYIAGGDIGSISTACKSFIGVKRRFDILFANNNTILIDDYAHHPEEIAVLIDAVKSHFIEKNITAIFQPHLYSRTRDLADDFIRVLSNVDELWLLDIYPAREKPIEGIDSHLIANNVSCGEKQVMTVNEIISKIYEENKEIILTIGAGNIDLLANSLNKTLLNKYETKH